MSFSFALVELYFVGVPLIFFCPADHVPDCQPRILLRVWLMPDRLL